jgi:hypothetical protein
LVELVKKEHEALASMVSFAANLSLDCPLIKKII